MRTPPRTRRNYQGRTSPHLAPVGNGRLYVYRPGAPVPLGYVVRVGNGVWQAHRNSGLRVGARVWHLPLRQAVRALMVRGTATPGTTAAPTVRNRAALVAGWAAGMAASPHDLAAVRHEAAQAAHTHAAALLAPGWCSVCCTHHGNPPIARHDARVHLAQAGVVA